MNPNNTIPNEEVVRLAEKEEARFLGILLRDKDAISDAISFGIKSTEKNKPGHFLVDKNIKKIEGLLETNISSSKVRRILREENGVDKLKYIVPEACLNVLEGKGFYNNKSVKNITNE